MLFSSVLGFCDSFELAAKANMPAALNWSAVIVDSPSATAKHTTDVQKLNLRFSNLPSNQSIVKLTTDDIIIGVDYNITVCGRRMDCSGEKDCDTKTIRRVGKNVPKIRFATSTIKIGPSVTLRARGEFLLLNWMSRY